MSVKAALDLVRHSEPRLRMSASGRIYDDLRQRILSLELPPGTNLLRTELATKYQVSQTPLRDALQRLEQDGLVQIFPQSRTLVTRIDIPLIHEAHFLRTALETEVVRQLARTGAAETVARGRSVLEMQRSVAGDRSQLRLFQELDEYLHRVLFDGLDRSSLHGLIRSRSGHLDRVRRLQVHSKAKIQSILEGHAAILDGIEARDEVAAMAAMRGHLRKSPDWVEEFRALNAEYFD
ncbi:GntR family transcriptional regulator [Pseudooceanicola sediminis]|uniref:GntR family transcriptional regulator n=1 Tax=Pseudooceanicola sediminis TaxID=2211117 RepID=A0A399IY56_9RHOB|nr:GntR family transcriptional regulator [Pseudooceanicola sediminis]KAA2315006.1 GntR family transcriptional regulator [Puniceibacterium sp. HSS470]RII37377.1 GntR family transcriptional regulator [Pseudooceanicola sediminis]|tara:strand:- start:64305 stop:65012 length:708 start_codon:yes stop_codon:yes gene_type:complete